MQARLGAAVIGLGVGLGDAKAYRDEPRTIINPPLCHRPKGLHANVHGF